MPLAQHRDTPFPRASFPRPSSEEDPQLCVARAEAGMEGGWEVPASGSSSLS